MRVTNDMMVSSSLNRLSARLKGYERAQAQVSSGRRITRPSDDPSGSDRMLSLRADRRGREQEARNGADATNWLNSADGQLQSAVTRLQRARDLAVTGATTLGAEERATLAAEVTVIRDELRSIANARHDGKALFAGYAAGEAVAADGTYRGDDGVVARRVSESDVVRVNVTAREAFGLDDPARSVFGVLDRLVADLGSGNTAGVAASLDGFDAAQSALVAAQTKIGAATNRVASAATRGEDLLLAIRAELSEVEDVDMAQAVMEMQMQEIAYEATLQALSKALPPSLISFMR